MGGSCGDGYGGGGAQTGDRMTVLLGDRTVSLVQVEPFAMAAGVGQVDHALAAPRPGEVTAVFVSAGETVAAGQSLMILEAMKMEQTLVAGADSVVTDVHVGVGDQVEAGAALITFEEKDA